MGEDQQPAAVLVCTRWTACTGPVQLEHSCGAGLHAPGWPRVRNNVFKPASLLPGYQGSLNHSDGEIRLSGQSKSTARAASHRCQEHAPTTGVSKTVDSDWDYCGAV